MFATTPGLVLVFTLVIILMCMEVLFLCMPPSQMSEKGKKTRTRYEFCPSFSLLK